MHLCVLNANHYFYEALAVVMHTLVKLIYLANISFCYNVIKFSIRVQRVMHIVNSRIAISTVQENYINNTIYLKLLIT